MRDNTSYQEKLWRKESELIPSPLAQVKVVKSDGSSSVVGMNRAQRRKLKIRRQTNG